MKDNQQPSVKKETISYEIGTIINDLEIIEKPVNKTTRTCKCLKCGYIYDVPISTLKSRSLKGTKGCAKCWQKPVKYDNYKYHPGDKIGDYELIECTGRQEGKWKVKCLKCGKEQIIRLSNARKRVAGGCSYCNGHVGQKMPQKSRTAPDGHLMYTLDELSYTEYKTKIEGFSKHEGRKTKSFELTLDDWTSLIHSNCAYCGAPPSSKNQYTNKRKTKPEIFYMNGIDRVDPNKGYIKSNCVPCCSKCNRMKWDLQKDEWVQHMKQILAFLNEGSTTIPEGSTSQANGEGNGGLPNSNEKEDDIV